MYKPLHRPLVRGSIRALLLCGAAHCLSSALAGNPYHRIYERNAFQLRPPQPAQAQASREPSPKVHLTGITTILRGKRALLKVEFPANPPNRVKEESYILREGQSAGPIKLLEINEKTAQVTVDNSGTVSTITFDKLPPTPSPAKPIRRWGLLPYRGGFR